VGAGGAIGLVLGGILTEYLSWRWCLYVNLIFAGLAGTGAVLLLKQQRARTRSRLDLPGVALVSASMFSLVYGSPTRQPTTGTRRPPTASWPSAWCC
jgi:MFS family permease